MKKRNEMPFVQNEYISAWRKINYEQICTMFPKKLEMGKTLDIASKKAGISKREYIRQAIIDRLHKDGFEVEARTEQCDKETGNSDKE